MTSIAPESMLAATSRQVSADISHEGTGHVVILDLHDGVYYELSDVGARIWALIQQPCSMQSVLERLLDEYDITREQVEPDLRSFVGEMVSRGLVEIRDPATG